MVSAGAQRGNSVEALKRSQSLFPASPASLSPLRGPQSHTILNRSSPRFAISNYESERLDLGELSSKEVKSSADNETKSRTGLFRGLGFFAIALSSATIATAWFAHRSIMAGVMFGLTAAGLVARFVVRGRGKR